MKAHRLAIISSSFVLLVLLIFLSGSTAHGKEPVINILEHYVTSEFPEGIRFGMKAEGATDIISVTVRLRIGQQSRVVYEYLDFEISPKIDAQLFWATSTSSRYIPPGTIITYTFELEDKEGNQIQTDPEEFIYYDSRFTWEEIAKDAVTVLFHGPVEQRAKIVLDSATETLDLMGPLLGASTKTPIRITMYNNVREMLGALPPGSATIRRELITEGQAFTKVGTLLVLGGGRLAKGTASHEVTHILTHRAGDGPFGNVPAWLDEGLAEFGNIEPSFSYDVALDFAIAANRLLPITSMKILPGDPEDVIIAYGQARSIVRYMVEEYGSGNMSVLMASLKKGDNIDDAIREVYGVERLELENLWRADLGAPLYHKPNSQGALPTPVPRPAVLAYSLTPQAQAEVVTGIVADPFPHHTSPEMMESDSSFVELIDTAEIFPPKTESQHEIGKLGADKINPGVRSDQNSGRQGIFGSCGIFQQKARGSKSVDAIFVFSFLALAAFGIHRKMAD